MKKTVITIILLLFTVAIAAAADKTSTSASSTKPVNKVPSTNSAGKTKTEEKKVKPILEHYNILSLDGGGVRGLIAVQIMKHFELYAYEYSNAQKKKGLDYNFPTYEGHHGVIAMKDMFDMSAGTSTGSFIAAGLGFPKLD